jgi:hypothetical protein
MSGFRTKGGCQLDVPWQSLRRMSHLVFLQETAEFGIWARRFRSRFRPASMKMETPLFHFQSVSNLSTAHWRSRQTGIEKIQSIVSPGMRPQAASTTRECSS